MVKKNQRSYYEHLIDINLSSPRDLWGVINSLVKGKQSPCSPTFDSDLDGASEFASFFATKVRNIRDSFLPSCSPPPDCLSDDTLRFDCFQPVTIKEVLVIISESKPKTCPLDPIPTWVVKNCSRIFAPIFCAIANLSLRTGVFPDTEKCAIITPVIKRNTLCKNDLNSYRPISNLSFLSKFIERIVSLRIDRFIFSHNLMSPFQSAYRPFHSTETVLLRLCNDI